ncbi:hemin uptake protein HemP [Luteimonas aestuarii]|nr:hemin uptake protein HemP [Luteimonas aestuarii]
MFVSSPASGGHAAAPSTETGHATSARQAEVEIDSLRLLQGQREVRIRHGNEWYRLRHTRNDKLILTK